MLLLEDRRFYVYIYLNPLKSGTFIYNDYCFGFEPFYVGKGQGKRYLDHIKEANSFLKNKKDKKYNKHKINTILKIKKELNCNPIIVILRKNMNYEESSILEENIIKIIGRSDLNQGSLTNMTDGGDGTSNLSYEIQLQKGNKIKSTREKDPTILENTKINNILTWSNPDKKKEHSILMTEINNKPEVKEKKHKSKQLFIEKNPNFYKELIARREQNYKEHPELKEQAISKNIENNKKSSVIRWSDPKNHEKASYIMKEVMNIPEIKEKTHKGQLQFIKNNPDFFVEKGKRSHQKFIDHPELLEEKRKREHEYYLKQKEIRYECKQLILKYHIDIKLPHHARSIDVWLKFKEELELIINSMKYKAI